MISVEFSLGTIINCDTFAQVLKLADFFQIESVDNKRCFFIRNLLFVSTSLTVIFKRAVEGKYLTADPSSPESVETDLCSKDESGEEGSSELPLVSKTGKVQNQIFLLAKFERVQQVWTAICQMLMQWSFTQEMLAAALISVADFFHLADNIMFSNYEDRTCHISLFDLETK